jgi:hypothetical protein
LQARWCGLPTAFTRLSALQGNNQHRKLIYSLFCCVVALDEKGGIAGNAYCIIYVRYRFTILVLIGF